jgi:hypothetical protein
LAGFIFWAVGSLALGISFSPSNILFNLSHLFH